MLFFLLVKCEKSYVTLFVEAPQETPIRLSQLFLANKDYVAHRCTITALNGNKPESQQFLSLLDHMLFQNSRGTAHNLNPRTSHAASFPEALAE